MRCSLILFGWLASASAATDFDACDRADAAAAELVDQVVARGIPSLGISDQERVPWGWALLEALVLAGVGAGLGAAGRSLRGTPRAGAMGLGVGLAGLAGVHLTQAGLLHGRLDRAERALGDADLATAESELIAAVQGQERAVLWRLSGRALPVSLQDVDVDLRLQGVQVERARGLSQAGDPVGALRALETAAARGPDSPALHDALCIGASHAVAAGAPDAAALLARLDACDLPAPEVLALHGHSAQRAAADALQDPPDAARAVQSLEHAWAWGDARGLELGSVSCDLAGALDARAVQAFGAGHYQAAVDALDRGDPLVPDRAFVDALRLDALLALGNDQVAQGELVAAVATLERGRSLAPEGDHRLRDALAAAWVVRGVRAMEQGDDAQSLAHLEAAHAVWPEQPDLQLLLADLLIARAEVQVRDGLASDAVESLERAGHVSPVRRPGVTDRIATLGGSRARLDQLQGAPEYLAVPAVHVEVPRDTDDDGRVDALLYYPADGGPLVAVASSGGPQARVRRLELTDAPGFATAILEDRDGDGVLDARTDYDDGAASRLVADVDRDRRPDVVRHFSGGQVVDEALSGRVLVTINSGVIGSQEDWWSEPDGYVVVSRNGRRLGATDVADNTNYPSWHQGIVVDFKHRDAVELDLWDHDPGWWNDDDHIDTWRFHELPESGAYRGRAGRAALDLTVSPSTLPEGYRVRTRALQTAENVFLAHPLGMPEMSDIIARAEAAQTRVLVIQVVTEIAVTQLLLPRLLPAATPIRLFMAELVVSQVVLPPAFGTGVFASD